MDDQYGGGYGQPPGGQPPYIPEYQQPGPQMPEYQPPGQEPTPGMGTGTKDGSGCLKGCLIGFAVVVVAIIGVGWYGWHWMKNNILMETPLEIQTTELTPEQQEALEEKLAPIDKAFNENTGEIMELTLTQDEVNWLLSGLRDEEEPTIKNWKAVFVFSENGVAEFRITGALGENFKNSKYYLNMEGKTEFAITEGNATIKIIEMRAGSYHPSENKLLAINNYIEKTKNDPNMKQLFERLRDVKIEEGVIHIKLKALKMPDQAVEAEEQ